MCDLTPEIQEKLDLIQASIKQAVKGHIGDEVDPKKIEKLISEFTYPQVTVEATANKERSDVIDVSILIPIDVVQYNFTVDKDGKVTYP